MQGEAVRQEACREDGCAFSDFARSAEALNSRMVEKRGFGEDAGTAIEAA
jgi:hypothetical protein